MNFDRRILGLSIGFGLLVWVVDAFLDAFFFYPGSVVELLILDVPPHEVYVRTVIIGLFVVFGLIVSNRTNKHQRKQEELNRYQRAADATGHAIYMTDPDGTIQYVNPAFEEMTGFTVAEAIGENPRIMRSGEMPNGYYEELWETLLAGKIWEEDVINRRKDGESYHAHQTIAPVEDAKGAIEAFIATQTDITDRKALQKTRRESLQQLRVIDRVLRHNVHNDLNVIRGYAETISDQPEGAVAEYAAIIQDQCDKLLTTVDKERKITKLLSDPKPVQPHDLTALVDAAVSEVRERYPGAELTVQHPDDVPVLATTAMYRALEELLVNAVIHSDRASPTVHVTVEEHDGSVQVAIVDDGSGIPEVERLILTDNVEMDPLYHGSGLGLWLVHLIVDQADGSLSFTENEPRGSIVTIELRSATPVGDRPVYDPPANGENERRPTPGRQMDSNPHGQGLDAFDD